MSTRLTMAKAQFTPQSGTDREPVVVHFNPVSLQFSVSNTLKEEASGKGKQYTTKGKGTGKLTMDLIFDNTADGSDVRNKTKGISAFMEPGPASRGSQKLVPPVILFEWGAYKFQGMMESYKETLDFFSADGVPLRASVNITLVSQDKVFPLGQAVTGGSLPPDVVEVPEGQFSPLSAASAGGNPDAARAIGALNASASLRFSGDASLSLTGSVTLGAPVAFASGGAGIGIGVSAGAGVSGGALFGSSASAGVSATQGAFAGLRTSAAPSSASIDTGRFLQLSESVPLSTGAGDFSVGGQAVAKGNAGLSTDVGANVDLRARIQFEVE